MDWNASNLLLLFTYRDVRLCASTYVMIKPQKLFFFAEEDLEGKTEEEIEMMKLMGFASFDSTKVSKRWNHYVFSAVCPHIAPGFPHSLAVTHNFFHSIPCCRQFLRGLSTYRSMLSYILSSPEDISFQGRERWDRQEAALKLLKCEDTRCMVGTSQLLVTAWCWALGQTQRGPLSLTMLND